jgi:GTP-binding protein EngB required for normal cell division
MSTFDHQAQHLSDKVRRMYEKEKKEPLKISIMGQTGVGKTSLVNALFHADLPVDPVRSTTKAIDDPFVFKTAKGELWFYDLPGLGESAEADSEYLEKYRQMLLHSDVVLWAIQADNRSFAFDHNSLEIIFEPIDKILQAQLMSKVTFILTKADLLTPAPWLWAKSAGRVILVPDQQTEDLLERKEMYLQEAFILPYSDSIVSQTYHDGDFDVDDPHISYDKNMIYYDGLLNKEGLIALKHRFKPYEAVFDRLYDNHRIISCSSKFRFNLDLLMRVIINKLGSDAVARFSNFFKSGELDRIPLSEARKLCNVVVFDQDEKRVIFDLAKAEL